MSPTLYDVELWREYAKQMRVLSQKMTDPRIRRHTLSAAIGFERIADLAGQLQSARERQQRSVRAA